MVIAAVCLCSVALAAAALRWNAARLEGAEGLIEPPTGGWHDGLAAQNDAVTAEVDRLAAR